MYNNIIKNALRNMISEERTPGIEDTKKVTKKSGDSNKEYYKEVESKYKDYDKEIREDEDETVKFNATDKQKEYHDEMEIRNGQEMLKYDNEPNEKFKERATKALTGDSTMGNKTYTGKWNPETGEGNGNTEPVWGASDAKFGEKLLNTAKASQKKRDDAAQSMTQFGDDIEIHKNQKTTKGASRKHAFESVHNTKNKINESSELGAGYTHFAIDKSSNKIVDGWDYKGVDKEEIKDWVKIDLQDNFPDRKPSEFKVVTRGFLERTMDPTDTNNWYKITETKEVVKENTGMKRLRFKNEFGGEDKAMKLIPENYKQDNKEFEMTDGNETYRVRWEGTVNEGTAIVLHAENQKMINEDIEKMKKLWGFNSKDTLGTLKPKDRLQENEEFKTIYGKTKNFLK